jgi:glycosyltransferase involved in cell wall biosynthesis
MAPMETSPAEFLGRSPIRAVVRRLRARLPVDRLLQVISRPRLGPPPPLPPGAVSVLLYSPANLNRISGSSVWVESVAETLLAIPEVWVSLPLYAPVRRAVITAGLATRPRLQLVDPHPRLGNPRAGLTHGQALDLIERLDRARPFDAIVLRSFETCLEATRRPRLRGRVWSCYILEPERDPDAPAYRAAMARIAEFSRYVAVQSDEMRALLESLVPACAARTIILPPAIPPVAPARVDPARIVRRLLYTGKFHPFYPFERMVDFYLELRRELADLEFHVAGERLVHLRGDDAYAPRIEGLLRSTPGLVWHGSLPRAEAARLLAEGGVGISLWDYRYGSRLNDLVVSTKLLDYAAVGLPTVLMRTATQVSILGPDYPLFVDELDEAGPLLRRVLTEPELYRRAAERTFEASRRFTYPVVGAALRPYLEGAAEPRARTA